MRKLRRKQELQDKRDRIRMGLLPPDAPKGDLSFSLISYTTNPTLPSSFGESNEGSHFGCHSRSDESGGAC